MMDAERRKPRNSKWRSCTHTSMHLPQYGRSSAAFSRRGTTKSAGPSPFYHERGKGWNGPRPSVSATVRLLIIPFAIWIALICFAVGIMYQPLSPSPLFIYASVVYCIFVIRPTMKQWQMHRVAMNPLRAAVASGNEDKVRAILGHGADAADGPAIMIAACRGQNRTLALLLDAGGDLDSSDDGVFTTAAVVSIFCCVCSGRTCRKFPGSLLRTIFRLPFRAHSSRSPPHLSRGEAQRTYLRSCSLGRVLHSMERGEISAMGFTMSMAVESSERLAASASQTLAFSSCARRQSAG